MRSAFSEFSYGYAVTEELLNWHGVGVTAVPFFPNLREEGHLGFDVRLDRPGVPLFLQFKLADGMERRSVMEIKDYRLNLSVPFFRMHLHRRDRSRQHELLLRLDQPGSDVYYVAPRFHRAAEFARMYRSHMVVDNSVFIRPSQIGMLRDNLSHHVSYSSDGTRGWFCSEPTPLSELGRSEALASAVTDRLSTERAPLSSQIRPLLGKVLTSLRESGIADPEFPGARRRTRAEYSAPDAISRRFEMPEDGAFIDGQRVDDRWRLRRISFLARSYFESHFTIVQRTRDIASLD